MHRLVAIDVAILPPRDVAETAESLSKGLSGAESQGLQLGGTRLPHVTLTQQFIPLEQVPDAIDAVGRALKSFSPLALRITGPGRGTSSVWMAVQRSPELVDLHQTLMNALLPFERSGGDVDAFVDNDARPGDLAWVAGFRHSSSGGRFNPHITLGHASQLPVVKPIAFDADTIALCQLGRFCTCQRVIRSWTLRPGGGTR